MSSGLQKLLAVLQQPATEPKHPGKLEAVSSTAVWVPWKRGVEHESLWLGLVRLNIVFWLAFIFTFALGFLSPFFYLPRGGSQPAAYWFGMSGAVLIFLALVLTFSARE